MMTFEKRKHAFLKINVETPNLTVKNNRMAHIAGVKLEKIKLIKLAFWESYS